MEEESLRKFELTHEKVQILSPEVPADNVLVGYLRIKALVKGFPDLIQQSLGSGGDHYEKFMNKSRWFFQGTLEDLRGATVGLLRLQETYKVPTSDLAHNISVDDAFFIGLTAHTEEKFYQAIPWFLEAERKYDEMTTHGTLPLVLPLPFNRTELYLYMSHAFGKTQNYEWALFYSTQIAAIEASYPIQDHTDYYESQLPPSDWDGTEEHLPPIRYGSRSPQYLTQYEALCRGEHQNSLHVARVLADATSTPTYTAEYRSAKHTVIPETDHSMIRSLRQRMAAMTNLNIEDEFSAETLQIANYGLGGHFIPHYDMIADDDDDEGTEKVSETELIKRSKNAFGEMRNRIATILIYGDAVFWYNLHRNGKPDLLTRHGACPVFHGSKWVANKWIHERGNEFMRKCALTADA